jgi:hypothetical protein
MIVSNWGRALSKVCSFLYIASGVSATFSVSETILSSFFELKRKEVLFKGLRLYFALISILLPIIKNFRRILRN